MSKSVLKNKNSVGPLFIDMPLRVCFWQYWLIYIYKIGLHSQIELSIIVSYGKSIYINQLVNLAIDTKFRLGKSCLHTSMEKTKIVTTIHTVCFNN